MKNCFWTMLLASCMVIVGCGDDSGTSAKVDDSSSSSSSVIPSSSSNVIPSSSSNVIPSEGEGSSSSVKKNSSSSAKSSSSAESSSSSATSSSGISFGTMTDARDKQTYKTVTIGDQTWMAENLNYNYNEGTAKSYCYNNKADSCAKYGRLYLWSAAMDSAAVFSNAGKGCGNGKTCNPSSAVRGVCPEGWRLPNKSELENLKKIAEQNAEDKAAAGIVLKSKNADGTDGIGFAALPAGYYQESSSAFRSILKDSYYWTSTESAKDKAGNMYLGLSNDNYGVSDNYKNLGFSVRCIEGASDEGNVTSSSSSVESSSSAEPSSSAASSSSEEEQLIPYTTECPAGKTCTYAPTKQLNPEITYGELLDTRDYQVYKTVTIGTQTWMAQNLNYAYTGVKYVYGKLTTDSTSWCYENVPDSCAKYGRLYTWAAAVDSVALANDVDNPQICGFRAKCNRLTDYALADKPLQGICPNGWHLPSYAEWEALLAVVGVSSTAGKYLKSASGWDRNGNGTDAYGFSVLPAGFWDYEGTFYSITRDAQFWSSSQFDDSNYNPVNFNARCLMLLFNTAEASLSFYDKSEGISVRCVKD